MIKKNKILFIGGMYPREKSKYYFDNTKKFYQAAADNFQWNLIEGLEGNLNTHIDILNSVFIYPYPKGFKKMVEPSYYWRSEYDSYSYHVGFINLFFIKNFVRTIKVNHFVKKWVKKYKDKYKLHIIVYSPHVPFISSVKNLEKYDVCKTLILPDLPDFTGTSNKNIPFYTYFKKKDLKKFYKLQRYIDNYVLLTDMMTEKLPEKKYVVIEGISDIDKNSINIENLKIEKNPDTYTVLYTGTLHEKYGIKNVVDSMKYIKSDRVNLVICGDGDSKDYIKKMSKLDNRIIYKGIVTREESIKLQKSSSLLINPRPNDEVYTKYSFPSKTIEYMTSETPILCFKLDGIPSEYDDYLNYLDSIEPRKVAENIELIIYDKTSKYIEIANKAKKFILKEKNNIKQTSKILEMLNIYTEGNIDEEENE